MNEYESELKMVRTPTPVPSTSKMPILASETAWVDRHYSSEESMDEQLIPNQAAETNIEQSTDIIIEEMKQTGRLAIKRERQEDVDDEGFEVVLNQKEKKLLKRQEAIEVYIYCKDKIPKQFALARLFKEVGLTGINKIKYINPYKIRVEAKDEAVANQIMFCKRLLDMDWRFQRALEVNESYGVIKGVDADLNDEEIAKCIKCPEPAILLSAKRLQKRGEDGKWVPCDVARLAFKGTFVPSHVFVDHLRITVEPYVFPVTQCSRCWKIGHSARRCSAKNIVCPKCGGSHDNCNTKIFKCVNCTQDHMALEKLKCPVFLKEKRVRELMSEYRCTYRKALTMYVKPDSPIKPKQRETITSTPAFSWPSLIREITQTEKENINETPKRKDVKVKEDKKQRKRRISKEKEQKDWWSNSESEAISEGVRQPEKSKDRRNTNTGQERNVTFSELMNKIKEVMFKRDFTFKQKVGEVIKLCLEWLVLIVVGNVSEWPVLKVLFNLINH